MRKFIISEEEKRRILNLHEGFKKGLLNEQVSGATSGTTSDTTTGTTKSNREPKSQASINWGKEDITTGPVIGKVYSTTIMNNSGVQEPVTFNMKVSLRKSSSKDGSYLGYAMWIYDAKSGKMMDQLDITCKTVGTYINSVKSKKWSQLDHFGKSQYKWYFNVQFLTDLYQTLGCK
jgi:hypothetical protein